MFWLIASILIASAAQMWRTLSGPDWTVFAWLLPIPVLLAMVSSALRGLPGPHGIPRDPKVHLQELQRCGEYWAVMLRLPPEGACDAAQALRKQVFDLYRVPSLPLAGCSSQTCKCGYSGLKDRRRRDVLPPGLERDRRAGTAIPWPGGMRSGSPAPPEKAHSSIAPPFAEEPPP
jgi:hypothetical protein